MSSFLRWWYFETRQQRIINQATEAKICKSVSPCINTECYNLQIYLFINTFFQSITPNG